MSVSWTAPSDTGGAPIIGWSLLYRQKGATPRTIHTPTPAASDTAAIIGSLADGAGYEVRLAAENSAGTGAWAFATATTHGKPGRPAAPSVVSGDRQLDASWVPPAANGSPITGYDFRYRYCTAADPTCAASPTWSTWQTTTGIGNVTSRTATGPSNGVKHQIEVAATNAVGTGPWSPPGEGTPSLPVSTTEPTVVGGNPANGADPAANCCYTGLIQSGWAGAGTSWTDPPEHRGPRVMIEWTWDSDSDLDGTHDPITHFEVQGGNPVANGWQLDFTIGSGQGILTGTEWLWPAAWSGPDGDHTDIQVRAASGSCPWSTPFQALCRLVVN